MAKIKDQLLQDEAEALERFERGHPEVELDHTDLKHSSIVVATDAIVQEVMSSDEGRTSKPKVNGITTLLSVLDFGFIVNFFSGITFRTPSKPRTTPGFSLSHMQRLNDLLPTPGLRKQTKKMMADQQAHIRDLVKQNRIKAARWQVACTWMSWVWYVLRRPATAVFKTLQGKTGS